MKRLTFRTDMGDDLLDAIAFINPDDAEGLYNLRDIAKHGSDELLYEIANRLAEYEDTRLEPEKIVFLKNVVDDAFSDKPEFTEHIRELLRTEKDGRLVVSPCKVGDSYFAVRKFCDEHGELEEPVEHWDSDCCGCNLPCNAELEVTEWKFKSIRHIIAERESIGVSIFLTREEAEKALEDVCKKNI